MPEMKDVLANPLNYGFEFVADEVKTDGQGDKGTSLGDGPILTVRNVDLFSKAFPGRIEGMLDGSSARVISQRVIRNARKHNSRISYEALMPLVLAAVLGVRAPRVSTVEVEVSVFPMPDGTTTRNRAEFLEAYGLPAEKSLVEQMLDGKLPEVAQAILDGTTADIQMRKHVREAIIDRK